MKIVVKQLQKKKLSNRYLDRLKEFTAVACLMILKDELEKVTVLELKIKDSYKDFYPKNKPLAGFDILVKPGGIVTIVLAEYYNKNHEHRQSFIAHELVHAKQLLSKKLVIQNQKDVIWNHKPYHQWKKFRFKVFNHLEKTDIKKSQEYLQKYLPWEKEVAKILTIMDLT